MSSDLHEPRARRYAEALASAAAAEQRIAELVEKLADHEWARSTAESAVDALRERLDLGDQQLISVTDDPPGSEIAGLIDLSNGIAWARAKRHDNSDDPNYWVKASASQRGAIHYEWPLDTSGPFIALPYEWEFSHVNRQARQRDEREDRIRERIRSMDGYPRDRWVVEIDHAVLAVLDAQEEKWLDAVKRAHKAEDGLAAANRRIAELEKEATS